MPRQSAIPVLVTRPEPQASRFAERLTARFGAAVRPVLSPLMVARFLTPDLPAKGFAALVLTSETGAEAAGRLRAGGADLPERAYCVGDRTAEAANALGFRAISARGDAAALERLIMAGPDEGPLLYLHGRDRAADLGAELSTQGRQVVSAAVYAQEVRPLSADAETVLAGPGPVLVPLFSPRSTRVLLAALPAQTVAGLRFVAISEAARAPLPAAMAAQAIVAARPDAAAMLDAISCLIPAPLP